LEAFEILDGAEAAGSAQFANDFVFAALIVGGRTEATRRRGFEFDAFDETIERQIEIEPRLFAVGDHVKAGVELVAHGDGDGVVDQFRAVCAAEAVEVLAGKFQPRRKRVAADDGSANGCSFMRLRATRCAFEQRGSMQEQKILGALGFA